MSNIKVVIVGNIAYDINTFPKRDNDNDKVMVNRGGSGYYSLVPSSLYTKTGIVARVGNDFDTNLFESYNIDMQGLKVINDSPTTKFHHTYLTDDGQTRTFKPEIYEKTLISIEDFPKEYYDSKYIHIATNFPLKQKEFIDEIRKHSNAIISIDTHEAYMEKEPGFIKEIFDSVDIAFIDKEFTELLDCKAPIKIIKMGKKGCKYISKDFSFIAKAKESEVIDKTGAGDVVTGVFLAMMAETNNPLKSLQTAVDIATKSIQDYGVDFLIKK
ncbi:MAG: hypothetical protein E7168_03435 [Firmicutes bacterium]|nr:hypothetical protein [Bacillota bacterium]